MRKFAKRDRQERAIERLEKTLTMHEANAELTIAIMEDKKMSTGAADKVNQFVNKKSRELKLQLKNTKREK